MAFSFLATQKIQFAATKFDSMLTVTVVFSLDSTGIISNELNKLSSG